MRGKQRISKILLETLTGGFICFLSKIERIDRYIKIRATSSLLFYVLNLFPSSFLTPSTNEQGTEHSVRCGVGHKFCVVSTVGGLQIGLQWGVRERYGVQ